MFRAKALLLLAALAAALPVEHVAPKAAVVRFAVAGDVGDGADRGAGGIAAVHAKRPLDAVLLVGDNIYSRGVASVHDPKWSRLAALTRLGLPLFPVLGNHDYAGNTQAQIDATGVIANWRFPAPQYVVRSSLCDVAMIDTDPFVKGKSSAADAAIRDAFAGSTATWRIVAGHHTIVSSGYHGYLPRGEHHRMQELLRPLRAVHADLYVCGHDHHEEFLATQPPMLVSGAGSDPVPPIALHLATRYPPEIAREPIGFAVLEMTQHTLVITIHDERGAERFRTVIRK